MDALDVLTPGPYTTVQDRGRFGFQQMGVPLSGTLDAFSAQIANLLVGNPPESAVLEITILGPRLCALTALGVALCGAEMDFFINDVPANRWEAIQVDTGDIITIGQAKSGCRGYLAVGGGIDVPVVMGSRSTYVGASLGGYQGRCLRQGDVLRVGPRKPAPQGRRFPDDWIPAYPPEISLRVIPGPQDDFFDDALEILFQSAFMVTPKADRMGYRLQGPALPIKEGMPQSIISEPTMPGGIQIPADRQAIILLVEQTVGGYAKIGTVITPDLSRLAQATPGDTLRFQRISLKDAHRLYKAHMDDMDAIARRLSAP
jgi:biotin-dependent carboxylase-like uncharacterized protein